MVWGWLIFLLCWGSNPETFAHSESAPGHWYTSKGGKAPTSLPYARYFINVQKLTVFAYGKENR